MRSVAVSGSTVALWLRNLKSWKLIVFTVDFSELGLSQGSNFFFLFPQAYQELFHQRNICMAEGETLSGISEADIKTLKETLQAQQQLLQTLYAELDQEREASATAASEALSMILRLQGEKAAVKMEASQYKRLAEEKMCHAEESLAIFEDLIYQKEMEIASLEFQVQAYKCKLLSLGFNDVVGGENRFPESLFFQGSDLVKGETCGGGGNVKRFSSLPPIPIKDSHQKKTPIERQKSTMTLPDLVQKMVEKKADQEIIIQSSDSEKKPEYVPGGNFDSYWQQIRMLDEQVKEISHSKEPSRDKKSRARSCPLPSPRTNNKSSDPTALEVVTNLDKVKHDDNVQEREENLSTCSSSIQDIFEVPKLKEKRKTCEPQTKVTIGGVENKPRNLDLASHETGKSCPKDETDGSKKRLHCKDYEINLSKPSEEVSSCSNVVLVQPPAGLVESQAQFQHLCRRVEQLERERNGISREITYAGDEERKLLREMHGKLNTIQAELYSWRKRKTKTEAQDDHRINALSEAMMYFWM